MRILALGLFIFLASVVLAPFAFADDAEIRTAAAALAKALGHEFGVEVPADGGARRYVAAEDAGDGCYWIVNRYTPANGTSLTTRIKVCP